MTRDPLDRYMTPPEFAEAAVAMLDDYCDLAGRRCLEPHVGAGSFALAMLRRDIDSLNTIDIDPECEWIATKAAQPPRFEHEHLRNTHYTADFLEVAARRVELLARMNGGPQYDLIAGNPPFADAELHIRAAHSLLSSRGVMGFVLPLHFLGSSGRRDFYSELMPTEVQTIRPRIPFAQEMREMGFYIWDKQAMGLGRRHFAMSWIDWTPTKKPRKPRKVAEIGTDTNGREQEDEQEGQQTTEEAGECIRALQEDRGEAEGPTCAEAGRSEGSAVPEGVALRPDDP